MFIFKSIESKCQVILRIIIVIKKKAWLTQTYIDKRTMGGNQKMVSNASVAKNILMQSFYL